MKKNGKPYKTCSKCRKKPEDKKPKNKKPKDKEFNKKEYMKEYMKEYYQNNKDTMDKAVREYHRNHRDKSIEYYQKNKAHIREYNQLYRQMNLEKNKQYRQEKWWLGLIRHSRGVDKRKEIYVAEDYIDEEHLIYQREDQDNKCFYCHKIMVSYNGCDDDYQRRAENRLSIERIDNNLGHNKENIVLACWGCNYQRNKRYSFDTFYQMKIMERQINDAQ
jgi:hypothetical protein